MSLSRPDLDRIIMMAWEDRTSFDAIHQQFGLFPGEVIKLMRQELKSSSFNYGVAELRAVSPNMRQNLKNLLRVMNFEGSVRNHSEAKTACWNSSQALSCMLKLLPPHGVSSRS